MFIDFVSLLLINMVIGYILLAGYVYRGLDDPLNKRWAPGFAMVGVIAFVFGSYMVLTWTLPGPFSSAYGEMSVLLGITFLGAALAITKGWSLSTVTFYAFFAGLAAIVIGARIIDLRMLKDHSTLVGAGFIMSGFGGVMAPPAMLWFRHCRMFRVLATMVLLAIALFWLVSAIQAYWGHMEFFSKWVPLVMRSVPAH